MRFLAAEMLLLIVASFALGLAVGAMLGRAQRRPDDETPLETEVARLRRELRAHGIDPDPPPDDIEITSLGELTAAPPELIELEPTDGADER